MKKLFFVALFAVLGMAQSAFAQLSVTCDGKEIKDGDVVKFDAVIDEETGDIVAGPEAEPFFKGPDGTQLKVDITIPASAGNAFLWCGITTDCLPVGPGIHSRSTVLASSELLPTAMRLHADFEEGQYATYSVKVEVAVNGKKDRTFYLVYKYADKATGIEGVEGQSENVKFEDNVCHYNFAVATPRTLNVYGVDGKLAHQSLLSAEQGSVNLNNLQKGAYVYSVVENGKKVKAGKLLVK